MKQTLYKPPATPSRDNIKQQPRGSRFVCKWLMAYDVHIVNFRANTGVKIFCFQLNRVCSNSWQLVGRVHCLWCNIWCTYIFVGKIVRFSCLHTSQYIVGRYGLPGWLHCDTLVNTNFTQSKISKSVSVPNIYDACCQLCNDKNDDVSRIIGTCDDQTSEVFGIYSTTIFWV